MKNFRQTLKSASDFTGKHLAEEKGPVIGKMTMKALEKATSIKDVLGFKDESIEGVYGQAYLLYNTGRYRDASEIFRLLIMLNSTESKYLMGLAACYHMLKEYTSAASTYNLVSLVDPENPVPYFHASDCYIQLGDKVTAAIMLEMAIKRAKNKAEFSTLLQRSQITLDALKKEISTPAS